MSVRAITPGEPRRTSRLITAFAGVTAAVSEGNCNRRGSARAGRNLHKIYRALGVLNRAQAVILASERGWI
jgi:hypothetical protein